MIADVARRHRDSPVVRLVVRCLARLGLLKLAFRSYERVLALETAGDQPPEVSTDGLAIPPPQLRVLVAGTADVATFLDVGRSMFQALAGLLLENGVRVGDLKTVLEFGCGCGRVLRNWRGVDGPQVYGVDYSKPLVEWCRAHLPFANCAITSEDPPLPHDDAFFDLVYAVSVFTHLSEEKQLPWMTELRRVIRPGGHLMITTHGASHRGRLTPPELVAFESGRLVVRHGQASGLNLCAVYHPEDYVRRRLSEGFVVVGSVLSGHQDLYLLRKLP